MNQYKKLWFCPNGCKIDTVLVCGGIPSYIPDSQALNHPNLYFQMTLEGEYTNLLADGTVGVPIECYQHADNGCCEEPICPDCLTLCVFSGRQ